jgi:Tfp pilus assembly pilus retraction ATPase PilT
MDHLVTLLTAEKARELRFCAGKPPVLALEKEERPLQGPPIPADEVERLLRSVANSRQIRELQQRGVVQFIFTVRNRVPVLVRAHMEDENLLFDIS